MPLWPSFRPLFLLRPRLLQQTGPGTLTPWNVYWRPTHCLSRVAKRHGQTIYIYRRLSRKPWRGNPCSLVEIAERISSSLVYWQNHTVYKNSHSVLKSLWDWNYLSEFFFHVIHFDLNKYIDRYTTVFVFIVWYSEVYRLLMLWKIVIKVL